MYLVTPWLLIIITIFGAFSSADVLSDIPKEWLRQIFGDLRVLSYDIEKQHVIEIPSQAETIPLKFMNENRNLQPLESEHPTDSSRRYLPTTNIPVNKSPDLYAIRKEVKRKQMSEGRPRNAYLPTEKTFEEDSSKTDSSQKDSVLDANDMRNSDQNDE